MDNLYSETGKDSINEETQEGKQPGGDSQLPPADSGGDATPAPADAGPAPVTLAALTGAHVDGMAGFDPARHAVDGEGNPRRKRDGSFAMKRGRKAGGTASPAPAPDTINMSGKLPPKPKPAPAGAGAPPVPGPAAAPVDFKAMAGAAVGASLGVAVMALGDEWRPRDKAEHSGLVDATAAYFEAQGVTDIPPGWLLLAVVSAYSLPRLTAPTTKSRLMAGWLRIKGFFKRPAKPLAGE